ncbi:MAG: hypothetical protein OQK75_09280 [Gammaproteobacteria bacterium]|nr:hypothetical protein [Gammaproteobacteria bacterium]MCW8987844.1 hypothetical protein [Gammaproteobacteria bacterium]
MKKIAVQISPEAKTAYFANYIDVAQQELIQVCGDIPFSYFKIGALEFFELASTDVNLEQLLKLSFTQGLYAIEGELLRPLDLSADFNLHEDFVFGSKFKGKTNERLTQMLINVGLSAINETTGKGLKLLDPMCGRATTLLWAIRYGFAARGIEQDPKAIEDIHRNLKKWTKLHRQKHKLSEGFIGESRKKKLGDFLDFSAADTAMRVVSGDARNTEQIFKKEKFDLIVSDLPYGVQHFTTEKTRNPLTVIDECISGWKNCLKKRGAVVLAFNNYNPKRKALIEVFEKSGFEALSFSAKHRMSESIVRDVVIFKLSE